MTQQIFISHASQDKVYAEALCSQLEEQGFPCWMAPRNIPAVQKWQEAIQDGIISSPIFLLILSQFSNQSDQVARELALAGEYKKIIICVRIEDIKPSKALFFYLVNIQWVQAIGKPVSETAAQLYADLTTSYESTTNFSVTLVPGSRVIHLGDDLVSTIRQAAEGDTIHLAGGEYRLPQRLLIEKDLILVGVDGRPRILCSAPESVLTLRGANWTMTGLDFIHEGNSPADVVRVEGKIIRFQDCTFAGAVWGGNDQDPIGSGLWLSGETNGEITGCTFHDNQRHGLAILGNSSPQVTDNLCEANRQSGIAYYHYSAGQATNNRCTGNGICGISVSDHATPGLRTNTCEGNKSTGIAYYDAASGQATGNLCRNNKENGLVVGGSARPLLEKNTLEKNEGSGIFIFGNSRVESIGNQSLENRNHGIAISGSACPKLEGNTCRGNGGFGIYSSSKARPRLGKNTLFGNKAGQNNLQAR